MKRPTRSTLARCGILLLLVAVLLPPSVAMAQQSPSGTATVMSPGGAPYPDSSAVGGGSLFNLLPSVGINGEEDYALPIQVLLLLTVLSLAPAIIILMTSFTRLVVVFGILRQAMGMQQSPPNQVMVGLALFLTIFIMAPILTTINDDALAPYLAGDIGQMEAFDRAAGPIKGFMLAQTREKDLMLFMDLSGVAIYDHPGQVPLHVLVPAYVISELRIAFQIGFMIFLPFLMIDLIVASVLMSMGMMMLPPVMISLPIKLLLFVLADGWYLIVESVVRTYTGT